MSRRQTHFLQEIICESEVYLSKGREIRKESFYTILEQNFAMFTTLIYKYFAMIDNRGF